MWVAKSVMFIMHIVSSVLHACIIQGTCIGMHGVDVTCEFGLTCCNGLQWLMGLNFVVHA